MKLKQKRRASLSHCFLISCPKLKWLTSTDPNLGQTDDWMSTRVTPKTRIGASVAWSKIERPLSATLRAIAKCYCLLEKREQFQQTYRVSEVQSAGFGQRYLSVQVSFYCSTKLIHNCHVTTVLLASCFFQGNRLATWATGVNSREARPIFWKLLTCLNHYFQRL